MFQKLQNFWVASANELIHSLSNLKLHPDRTNVFNSSGLNSMDS